MSERLAPELACPFAALVERRVLGDASAEEVEQLDAHVAQGCTHCAQELAEHAHLERLIQGAFRPLDDELERRRSAVVDRVKDALRRDDERSMLRRRRRVGVNAIFFLVVSVGLVLMAAEFAMTFAAIKRLTRDAQREVAKVEVHALAVAIARYAREHNQLPPDGAGLAVVLGTARSHQDRPYYAADPRRVKDGAILDPWGRPYVYRRQTDSAVVASLGPNGKSDEDDIAMPIIFVPR